ncbi:MAG: GNAT family N-acetyltransferase, partial [Arcobacteraceae bacterium]
MIILETTQLVLKTIEKEDSQVLYDLIFSDQEMMKSTFNPEAFTLEEAKKFIYKNFCKNNAIIGLAPLFEKKTGQIVGLAGTLENKELGANCFEFCCIIAENFRKNGYASE